MSFHNCINIKSVLFITGLTLLFACSGEEDGALPQTESENLNMLLNSAKVSWIDLNRVAVDTLVIPADKIFQESLFVDETLYVAHPIQIKAFGDYLVTLEFSSAHVAVTGKDGIPVRTIGRSGRGPGEFERPIAVMSDGTHLYIYDDGLKRISVFDADFSHVDTFDFRDGLANECRMDMNETYLIHQNAKASGFHAEDPESHLLNVRKIENPDQVYFEAIPRIVPSGMHPGAYNNLWMSINSNDEILATFHALPYLFLYRNFQHEKTIALNAVHYDTTANPSLRPYPPVDNTGRRVIGLMNHIHLMNNGDILFFSFRLLHHLKAEVDGSNQHYRTYFLKRGDTGDHIMTIRDMDFFPDEPNRFYAIGWEFLFELNLPE